MTKKPFEKAVTAAGIAKEYINARGKPEAVSVESQEKLLAAMHILPTATPAPLPPCKVLLIQRQLALSVGGRGEFSWQLQTEKGKTYEGVVQGDNALLLPAGLGEGYHQLHLRQGKKTWTCQLIIAPKRCYEPPALKRGEKLWGACVQLYTLRSEHNWGMGDFGDLQRMVAELGKRGGAFIGLNPIHALYPSLPENASPYSPSSRRWLNVLYIDVAAVADFQQSEQAQRWWQQPGTQQDLRAAREADWVDYERVGKLKISGLRHAWTHFSKRASDDEARQDFEGFVADGGESLFNQAVYDALHAAMVKEDAGRWGWPAWPEALQHGNSDAVQQFCRQHQDEVNFWLWLQWLANRQFDDCWQVSQTLNMPVGLYRDLAVGVAEGGVETWCDRELYCLKASVGAPPDILGPQGQNWGLPPLDPHVMKARGYQPFIDLLRANMASCGALRIDHVMSLLRLWWIPYGETADHGAYVSYPVDDLMAILALESRRQRCMVIGEDLGTVPEEIVGKLRDFGIYSWKVLYFEQRKDGSYRSPDNWKRQAMASITTHDLPTLRGFWSLGDLTLGEKLGVYPDKAILNDLVENRQKQKQALLDALHRTGCVPQRYAKRAADREVDDVFKRGVHRYVAESRCALLGLQPEDWLGMQNPVNVPGTTDNYPNWRRKLSTDLAAMFADDGVNRLLKETDRRRKADKRKADK